jgi:hypothetical protein
MAKLKPNGFIGLKPQEIQFIEGVPHECSKPLPAGIRDELIAPLGFATIGFARKNKMRRCYLSGFIQAFIQPLCHNRRAAFGRCIDMNDL